MIVYRVTLNLHGWVWGGGGGQGHVITKPIFRYFLPGSIQTCASKTLNTEYAGAEHNDQCIVHVSEFTAVFLVLPDANYTTHVVRLDNYPSSFKTQLFFPKLLGYLLNLVWRTCKLKHP